MPALPRVDATPLGAPTSAELSRDAVTGVRHFLKRSAGIPVLIVLNPQPDSARSPQFARDVERIHDQLNLILKDYPQARCANPFLRFYPDALFGTEIHLEPAGAVKNSHDIDSMIKLNFIHRDIRVHDQMRD